MSKKFLKTFLVFSLVVFIFPNQFVSAVEDDYETDVNVEVTAGDLGESEDDLNTAYREETESIQETGILIEIGNTTAENTTIIVRIEDLDGQTIDETLEVNANTLIQESDGSGAWLSDWIAGDQIIFWAERFKNSGQLVASRIRNLSFRYWHFGKNGWIKAIRSADGEVDVEWSGSIFTLNISKARLVAGLKNPATVDDFKVGDRVRARVKDDGDQNPATWDAEILVVLRRGNDLFMRVTRWVVLGRVVALPDDLTLPAIIDVEILPTDFFEKGDVNNLVGEPGDLVQVEINDDTRLVRRYLGNAFLKEFSEGDQVRIIGRQDEVSGNLIASYLKNNNIQRLGVANKLGKVSAIDSAAGKYTVELINSNLANNTFTILTDAETRFFKLGEEIGFSDVLVDDIVRVRGTLTRDADTVSADYVNVVIYHNELLNQFREQLRAGINQLRQEVKNSFRLIKEARRGN